MGGAPVLRLDGLETELWELEDSIMLGFVQDSILDSLADLG